MSNKTNIEKDIKMLKELDTGNDIEFKQAIENILADRERLLEDKKILEDNYKLLSEDVSMIAKELNLQEDATIDEIYTAIRILKSKRLNMFEILECNDKAKKYDNLIEKIKEIVKKLKHKDVFRLFEDILVDLQEILDTEQEKNQWKKI